MMNVQELRVLNYVLDIGGKVCQVMRVHANGVVGLSAIDGSYQWESFKLPDMVKPIPLTEEWLERFGFESHYDFHQKYFSDKEWMSWTKKGGLILHKKHIGVTHLFPKIQYVHQLQNLYFALTGEELTLKDQ